MAADYLCQVVRDKWTELCQRVDQSWSQGRSGFRSPETASLGFLKTGTSKQSAPIFMEIWIRDHHGLCHAAHASLSVSQTTGRLAKPTTVVRMTGPCSYTTAFWERHNSVALGFMVDRRSGWLRVFRILSRDNFTDLISAPLLQSPFLVSFDDTVRCCGTVSRMECASDVQLTVDSRRIRGDYRVFSCCLGAVCT